MEAEGSVPSRTDSEAPTRGAARVSRPTTAKPSFRRSAARRGAGDGTKRRVLTWRDLSASAANYRRER